ncbi:hypothetical protein [Nocardioides terrisoli]|uniref:hypothetical protein n=1 Tax=Nocardioides terrisoli TaxID=3388267 RepID=UPI00287BAD6B|nr:hypothetical protein [Nocardioides marmorisolisilvae]
MSNHEPTPDEIEQGQMVDPHDADLTGTPEDDDGPVGPDLDREADEADQIEQATPARPASEMPDDPDEEVDR